MFEYDEDYDNNFINQDFVGNEFTETDYEVNEYLESINDDFIPRRSAQPYLRAVYPAGFEVSKHRNLGVKYSLNEIDSTLYNSIGSSSSHVIKGRPPPGFSFVKWAQGGPENIIEDEIDDEEDADPYSGVAGRFRKVKPRRNKLFKDKNKRIHHLKELKLEIEKTAKSAGNLEPAYPGIRPATLAVKIASQTSLHDDLDALISNMDIPVPKSTAFDEESMGSTISLATMMSSIYSAPIVPKILSDILRVEVVDLHAYLDHQFSIIDGEEPRRFYEPINFTAPIGITVTKMKIEIVNRVKDRGIRDLSVKEIALSFFNPQKRYWRDIFRPLDWEQAVIIAREDNGHLRIGYASSKIFERSHEGSINDSSLDLSQSQHSNSQTYIQRINKTNTIIEGRLQMEKLLASPDKNQNVKTNTNRRIMHTSARLAPRKLTLPSATMIRSRQNENLRSYDRNSDSAAKIERMNKMAASLEGKLMRTRW